MPGREHDLSMEANRSASEGSESSWTADNSAHMDELQSDAASSKVSVGRSAKEDQSRGSSQQMGSDSAQDAERTQRRIADDAQLAQRWPEVNEAVEAALKEQYRGVREQAESARQAVESAARDSQQRFAQASQDLSDRQSQEMAAQQSREPKDVQQLQERQEQDRKTLEADFQRKSADLGEVAAAIERELNSAQRDVAEARANGPREDQGLDQNTIEKLSQREDNLRRIEQECRQAAATEAQQSAVRSAKEDQSRGSSQQMGSDSAHDAERTQGRIADDAQLVQRWPEVNEAAEAALKEQYRAVREQAESARQAVESAARDLEQHFGRASQDLSDRQTQEVAAQQSRDPKDAQQLQERQEQDRKILEADFQRKSGELGEAAAAIERELNSARRDVAEARANGPREDHGLDQNTIEKLSQREDNLRRIEQECGRAANNEAQQSALRSAKEDQSHSEQTEKLRRTG